jgi:glycosyltransferase involved in cell wall biosynthesis
MRFEKQLRSLARGIVPSRHREKFKKSLRRITGSGGDLEDQNATLISANFKTYKWLIEQAAGGVVPQTAGDILVSIVMPTWNRRDIIQRAIKSALSQYYQNWGLIIVDDGSTDGTREAIERHLIDPRLRYIYQDHRNAAAARNKGLANAQGEIITYLDTDVIWFPGYLSNIVAAFAEDEELEAVYTAQLIDDAEKSFCYVRFEEFDYDKLCEENYIDLNVFAHRRLLSEREGGFDEKLDRLIDWDLILRYTRHGKVRRLPALGGIYTYGRSDQITKTRSLQPSSYLIESKRIRHADKPLKALYALWVYPQLSESYIRTEIRAVRQLGVEVEVWSEKDVASPFESEVPVHRGSLTEAIVRFKPDIVHTHWLHMAERLSQPLKRAGLPLTVRGHGFEFTTEIVAKLDKETIVQRVYVFPHHAERCRSSSGKVRAMQVAFDTELYYPCEEKDHRTVMRTGCALPTKDYETFFRTAQLCPDHHFLLVVCRGCLVEDYLDEVIRKSKKFGDLVEIKVGVQHEEMSELMRRAGIYLHTADPNEPFGMPISISEAMATGSYIVGRQLPGSASYIGETGKLYRTPEEAAEVIRETCQWTDGDWRQAYVRSIDRAYSNFAHKKVIEPLVEDWRGLRG